MSASKPPSEKLTITEQDPFVWTEKRSQVAIAISHGKTKGKAAIEAGISRTTVYNWSLHPDFGAEIDRLSKMSKAASKGWRLRMINRLIDQKIRADGTIECKADISELLKMAAAESDGQILDLSSFQLETVEEVNTPPPTPPSEPELSSEQVS